MRTKILADIEDLQASHSKELFKHAVKLFFEKWSNKSSVIDAFLTHFKNEWLDKNSGWFEGMAEKIPSTDNGLEAVNGVIKKNHTLRERMSVSQYLYNAMKMMRDWSKDRLIEKPFYDEPKVDGNSWRLAYDYLYKSKPSIQKTSIGSSQVYILTRDENKHLINSNVLKNKFDKIKMSFDEIILCTKKVKVMRLDKKIWSDSLCSCSYFLKNYFCYHLIALAVKENILAIPMEYKNLPIEFKPKRGRKPKTKKALIRN